MQAKKKELSSDNRIRMMLSLVLVCALIFSVVFSKSNGWFSKNLAKYGDSDSIAIEEPPILYILDSDAEDITQLSLTGLEIGVDKKIAFCISSVYPVESSGHGHKISFNLELAFTNNLGANFDLYNAEIVNEGTPGAIKYESQHLNIGYFVPGSLLKCTDDAATTANGNKKAYTEKGYDLSKVQQKNVVTYQKYLTSSVHGDANNSLNFTENGKTGLFDTSKCRFFILDISWDLDTLNRKEVEKETDMIYILARGGAFNE